MNRIFLVIPILVTTLALARGKEATIYAESGVIESFHALQEVSGSGYALPSGYGGSSVNTFERRIYVLRTESSTLEITGWEKRGLSKHRPALTIGQVLSFRQDDKFFYTVLSDGKEHRYYVMSAKKN